MSRGATITLGVAVMLLAVGFMAVPATPGMSTSGLHLCGLFCFLIALACLVPYSRPVTARLIAAVVFGGCVWCVYQMWHGPLSSGSRSQPSLVNAAAAFIFFGLPAGYVIVRGIYPRWGRAASAFRERSRDGEHGDLWPTTGVDAPITVEGVQLSQKEFAEFSVEFGLRSRQEKSRWLSAVEITALILIISLEMWVFVRNLWDPKIATMALVVTQVGSFAFLYWSASGRTRSLRWRILREHGHPICLACGYNLQGGGRDGPCPECGWRRQDI